MRAPCTGQPVLQLGIVIHGLAA